MIKKVLHRILIFIPTILLISLLAFVISINAPGDPVENLATAMGQDGASSQNVASNNISKNKIRKMLGLDKPIFYFGLGTLSDSDTLYKIPDREKREALKALSREIGNWDEVMEFQNVIRSVHNELNQMVVDSLLNPVEKNLKASLIFSFNMLQVSTTVDMVEKRILGTDSICEELGKGFNTVQLHNALTNLKENSKAWKTYIPSINLYGFNNQYHIWLFGDWLLPKSIETTLVSESEFMQPFKDFLNSKKEEGEFVSKGKTYLVQSEEENEYSIQIINETVAGRVIESEKEIVEIFKNESAEYYFQIDEGRKGAIRGDFGKSFISGKDVSTKLWEKFKVSFVFIIFSIILSYFVSIPIGIYAAYKKGGTFDRISSILLFILYSIPSFFAGTVLLYTFANPDNLFWFPESGLFDPSIDLSEFTLWETIVHQAPYHVLPLIVYTYGSFAFLSRIMRVGMVDVLGQDYIRTARAKGLSEKVVVLKHALRNSLIPLITVFSNVFPAAVGGSVIIEVIFSIQGMGLEGYNAILNYDYPMIMAIFTISGTLTVFGYLVADVLYSIVDPRISFRK